MKSQVNFSHLIAVVVGVLIPVIIWGVSVETRFGVVDNNRRSIESVKKDVKENRDNNQENFTKILEKLHGIELSLMGKEDRF